MVLDLAVLYLAYRSFNGIGKVLELPEVDVARDCRAVGVALPSVAALGGALLDRDPARLVRK